ncbi:MAG: DUF4199 domain-containing protein [Reichenbachiella sp.]
MNNELNITGLKHGGIIGGLAAIVSLLLIMISRDLYMTMSGIGIPLMSLTLFILLGIKERKEQYDNALDYGEAFIYSAIALFIVGYMTSFVNISIIRFIDPEIQNVLLNEGMAQAEKMFEMVSMSEKEIDEQMINMEIELKNSFNYMSLVSKSWAHLLSAAFLGAIAAIFIKKSQPDFAEE